MQIEIVTPEKSLYSGEGDMVIAPGGKGDFGALSGHTPMISTLRAGIIEVHGKEVSRFFIRRGFAEVNGLRCVLLAESAIDLSKNNRDDIVEKRACAEAKIKELKEHGTLKAAEIEATESMIQDLNILLEQI